MRMPAWKGSGLAGSLIATALVLGGCASQPPVGTAGDAAKGPFAKRAPSLPRAGSGRGGYYMDDGPGDDIPEGLENTPDAEPRIEPYNSATSRPYKVLGKTYTPITDDKPFKQRGYGSWYGKKFHGQKTASGELYDMYQMTAAHPTLPIPSYARVTNLGNGKQVIVRINDRGPFLSKRIIDLSYTAALKLGYVGQGSAKLEVERLLPEEILRIASRKRQPESDAQGIATAALENDAGKAAETAAVRPGEAVSGTQPAVTAAKEGYYLQLGAYSQKANAESMRSRLALTWSAGLPPLEVAQQGAYHRIYSGPFASRAEAEAAMRSLKANGSNPMIVQR